MDVMQHFIWATLSFSFYFIVFLTMKKRNLTFQNCEETNLESASDRETVNVKEFARKHAKNVSQFGKIA